MQLSAFKKTTLLDYPGKIATIVFTPGCNFRCGFCHNPEFVLPEQLAELRDDFISEEVFFEFLEKRIGFLDGVVICGWEPTIHADLPDFCRKIKDMGFLAKLDTNGSNPDVIEHLLDHNLVDYIAMDIKHRLDRYIETAGNKTDPSVYTRSIALIMTRAPDYEFRTTVIKGIHGADDIAVMAQMIDWARRYFLQNYRAGHTINPNYPGTSFTTPELKHLCEIAGKYVEKCSIRM